MSSSFELRAAAAELETLQVNRDDVVKVKPHHNEVVAGLSYTGADQVTVFFHRNRGNGDGHGIRILVLGRQLSGYGGTVATWHVSSETFVPTPTTFQSRRGGGFGDTVTTGGKRRRRA